MTKKKKDLPGAMTNQTNLFPGKPEPGSLDIRLDLCQECARALKNAGKLGKSIHQVAAEMTDMIYGNDCEQSITAKMIYNWNAPSHEHHWPAEYLPAYCIACLYFEPLKIIGRAAYCEVLIGEDAKFAVQAKILKEYNAVKAKMEYHQIPLH
jgi:hypothetical protein